MINLYLVAQTENREYDSYDSFVVAAHSPGEAKLVHPSGDARPVGDWYSEWVADLSKITVELIGVSETAKAGQVFCASFNAG